MKKKKTPKDRVRQILGVVVIDNADQKTAQRRESQDYGVALSNLAVAEALLMGKPGQDSAQSHFIALVKEIEKFYGFRFDEVDEE